MFSANGATLKGRGFDFDTNPDGDGFVLSCAEGSLTANSFILKPDEEELGKIHPGWSTAPSAMIHLFGVEPRYEAWRTRLKARSPDSRSDQRWGMTIPGGTIVNSERNAPPLFGLGLIDALPEEVLVATAAGRARCDPRAGQSHDERPGREIRLEGPDAGPAGVRPRGLRQRARTRGPRASAGGLSPDPGSKAKGPDLSAEEWDALIAYVRALPAPIQLDGPRAPRGHQGRPASFEEIGCADCHRPSLGGIKGIYSDLLLHDMGPDLVSVTVTSYYGPPEKVDMPTSGSLADGTEWRTPPLWGYRDSGPYLHDGRARDLAEVVKAHKGQAFASATGFNHLSPHRRSLIERSSSRWPPRPRARGDRRRGRGPEAAPFPAGLRDQPPPRGPAPAPMPADVVAREDGEHRSASRLRMAQALEGMDKPAGALDFDREIVRDAPGTDAARTAAARIKALGGEDGAAKQP